MEFCCKTFDQLTNGELYELLMVRSAVFVVEQNCIYQDMDGRDPECLHLFYKDDAGQIVAYLRLFWRAGEEGILQMGRVLTVHRGQGLGGKLLHQGVLQARRMGAKGIYLEAQTYAEGFYAREGFTTCSDPFLEDGIPHVEMRLLL